MLSSNIHSKHFNIEKRSVIFISSITYLRASEDTFDKEILFYSFLLF